MAPRVPLDEDSTQVSVIHNHAQKGLAIYDNVQVLHTLSNFHWDFIAELKDPALGLVGYNVGITVFPEGQVGYVFIARKDLLKERRVEDAIRRQTKQSIWMNLGQFSKYWKSFIDQGVRNMVESNSGRITGFVKMTGLNTQIVDFSDRSTEVYAFSKDLMLDSRGKPLSATHSPLFWYNAMWKDSIGLIEVSFQPGPRDILAGLIRRACPSNFFPFVVSVAMGIAGFHGPLIRHLTTAQAPVCILMSEDNGTAQGKTQTAKGVLFLVSSTRNNRMAPNTDYRTVLKKISRTSLVVLLELEDVRNPKWFNKILESRYDKDQVQMVATCTGDYTPVPELIATANRVDPKICDERYREHLMVVPFGPMHGTKWHNIDLSSADMQSKANEYHQFINSNQKPMEFLISEMGDWIRSPEFMESREAMTELLSRKAMGIKHQTISNNYATGYAITRKIYDLFSGVWHDMGYTWDDFLKWMVKRHIPAMQIIHVE